MFKSTEYFLYNFSPARRFPVSAERKNKIVEDLSQQTEDRVKSVAVTAARSAVRKLWNLSFSSAIEHEITFLYKESMEKSEDSTTLDKKESAIIEKTLQEQANNTNTAAPQETTPQDSTIEDNEIQTQENIEPPQAVAAENDQPTLELQESTAEVPPMGEEEIDQINLEENESQEQAEQVQEDYSATETQGEDEAELSENENTDSYSDAVKEIDSIFFNIIDDFSGKIMTQARNSTEYILEVSNKFLDENAQNALQDFHNLYFGDSNQLQNTSQQINAEVDAMLDNLQGMMKEGKEISDHAISESEGEKLNRLSLAGLQKRLETIITMDEGIKEKLIPVLHSMQFEDFLNQRLQHIRKMWGKVLEHQKQNDGKLEIEQLKDEIKHFPSSVPETEDFYRIVMKSFPPEGLREKQNLVDILF